MRSLGALPKSVLILEAVGMILLAVAYLLFSILPPTGRLFAEQAGVPAASIPF